MERLGILLANLEPSIGLADRLDSILSASQVRTERMEIPGVACGAQAGGLQGWVAGRDVQAVFLVLPPEILDSAWLSSLEAEAVQVPVFAVTPDDRPGDLFELLCHGVTDFVLPPLTAANVLPRLWRSLEHLRPANRLSATVKEAVGLRKLVGESPAFRAQTGKIPLLARCDAGVLIYGETGTGKELVARAIHYLSPRAKGPFVPVNCGAIPVELAENELFGHDRSAFTGAGSSRPGLIEEADGGTLFLDEIDCLPPLAQVKVLRYLQDGEFRRLGSTRVRHSDSRVIAATNTDVAPALESGALRPDLYYRLNVVAIDLPPLRDRREDIPRLARHFLRRYIRRFGRSILGFTEEALEALMLHDWPGNVRELEHVVERAVVLTECRSVLERRDLSLPVPQDPARPETFNEAKARVVERFERSYIEKMLAVHRGNISHAACAAERSRRGFFGLIRKHRIDVDRFRSPYR